MIILAEYFPETPAAIKAQLHDMGRIHPVRAGDNWSLTTPTNKALSRVIEGDPLLRQMGIGGALEGHADTHANPLP